jgi:hypothetical protein
VLAEDTWKGRRADSRVQKGRRAKLDYSESMALAYLKIMSGEGDGL